MLDRTRPLGWRNAEGVRALHRTRNGAWSGRLHGGAHCLYDVGPRARSEAAETTSSQPQFVVAFALGLAAIVAVAIGLRCLTSTTGSP
jgi:hypothetical protein